MVTRESEASVSEPTIRTAPSGFLAKGQEPTVGSSGLFGSGFTALGWNSTDQALPWQLPGRYTPPSFGDYVGPGMTSITQDVLRPESVAWGPLLLLVGACAQGSQFGEMPDSDPGSSPGTGSGGRAAAPVVRGGTTHSSSADGQGAAGVGVGGSDTASSDRASSEGRGSSSAVEAPEEPGPSVSVVLLQPQKGMDLKLQLVNTGTEPLDLALTRIRYYYELGGVATSSLKAECYWTQDPAGAEGASGCDAVDPFIGFLLEREYFEVYFLRGQLAAGARSSKIDFGIKQKNNATEDYSYTPTDGPAERIVVYVDGEQVWGTGPSEGAEVGQAEAPVGDGQVLSTSGGGAAVGTLGTTDEGAAGALGES
ncbi:hypothetical protein ACFL5O_03655 [Myxococcota bacterium]